MPQRNELNFSTGERVIETTDYVCDAGVLKQFKNNDTFPVCPVKGRETTWRKKK
ncbi:hypothetical protein [Alkalihalobacterium chitinilyticum]|uniref:Uncharacterized protein n=1 Tax=Alkalihalobacterium chitinilyticum TaxID=2980103 RepID=A0ABT5VDD7_9BACI|nr:hypothetical protein [Alkalihalobacterium chitinilyticum]MDE5413468.1 hypothetical protein [Alkalihalobacterium chitinilyticum]